jgi:hypothetical protein
MEVTGRERQRAGGGPASTWQHIEIAETLERLYLFLTQYIDSCERDGRRMDYPQIDLETNVASTRAQILEILKVNPVVRAKVDKECERVFTLGRKSLMGSAEKVAALDVLDAHRIIFQHKTMAIRDLLAIYRAS